MSVTETLQALHRRYCELTGLEIKWQPLSMEHIWFLWLQEGGNEENLELTIKYLSKLYCKRPDILAACLRLRRLIGDTLFYAEMLAEARKIVRVKEENEAKASVLRATGRPIEVPKDAVPVSKILASQAFRDMVKLKESLKHG